MASAQCVYLYTQVKCVWKMKWTWLWAVKKQTGEKNRKKITLNSIAKNKRKIILKYSFACRCVRVSVCVEHVAQVEHLAEIEPNGIFTRKALWKIAINTLQILSLFYFNISCIHLGYIVYLRQILDELASCQKLVVLLFARPLNYNCKYDSTLSKSQWAGQLNGRHCQGFTQNTS